MLSDEEKEAIEFFEKSFKKKIPPYWYDDTISNIEEKIKVILNLIEKQQKEIEELKQDRDEYKEEYIKLQNARYYNYISKDKIKAKIEELEIEQESNREDLKIAIDNLIFQNIDKIGNKISINMSVRGVLQSLLEKE